MKLFGTNPTLWIGFLAGIITLAGTLGFRYLNGEQAVLAVVAINAVAAAVNAYTVRPISPAIFTYAVGSLIALAAAYGLSVSQETLGALNALVIAFLALQTRGQVSPVDTPISKSTFHDQPVVPQEAVIEPNA
jgi:hypothetical protein